MFAALFAWLLACSSLSQAAHFLTVQHVICAEHGELSELHELHELHEAEGNSADAASAHADEPSASHDSGGDSEESSDHEHCQLLARNEREQATIVSVSVELRTEVAHEVTSVVRVSAKRSSALSRLFVAPKTSPPAGIRLI